MRKKHPNGLQGLERFAGQAFTKSGMKSRLIIRSVDIWIRGGAPWPLIFKKKTSLVIPHLKINIQTNGKDNRDKIHRSSIIPGRPHL